MALIKTFMSERFAALNAIVTGQVKTCSCFIGGAMDNIKLYEIDPAYVKHLSGYAAHLFHNRQPGQSNERKYIGVILTVNGMIIPDYFGLEYGIVNHADE